MAKRSTKKNRCSYVVTVRRAWGKDEVIRKRFSTLRAALKEAKRAAKGTSAKTTYDGRGLAYVSQHCRVPGRPLIQGRVATCSRKGVCKIHPRPKQVKSHDWRKKGRMKVRRR